jgi:hypothetical protein
MLENGTLRDAGESEYLIIVFLESVVQVAPDRLFSLAACTRLGLRYNKNG